jgi:hypothetical protein
MSSYPPEWKQYFLQMLKNCKAEGDKVVVVKKLQINQMEKHKDPSVPSKTLATLVKSKVAKLDEYDKVRPWKRNDVFALKKQIFMTEEEAKECTFVPKTGSKASGKVKDLAMTLHPGIATIFSESESGPDKWLSRLGKNVTGRNPMLHKIGVLKQAKLLFKNGQPIKAYERLEEAFNLPSILKKFEPEKFAKAQEAAAKSGEMQRERIIADEMKQKHPENFEKKENLVVLEKVYRLIIKINKRR